MNGDPKLYQVLESLNIKFEYHEHPAAPTVEAALQKPVFPEPQRKPSLPCNP